MAEMSPHREQVTNTVLHLFREFERRGVRYALLRNGELLGLVPGEGGASKPTDVDLAVAAGHVGPARQAIIAAADAEGWDVVTECDHWTRSRIRHHHIEVFRLYRLNPLEFLEVDIFHAYLLWGLPLVDEQGLLEGTIRHPKGYEQVEMIKERTFALLQIYATARRPAHPKFARYRNRFLQAWASEQERMLSFIHANFGRPGERAVAALAHGDLRGFVRKMRWAKLSFLAKFASEHPLCTPRFLFWRAWENRARFHTRQCGFLLKAYAPRESDRALLREAMHGLTQKDLMERWKEQIAGSTTITPAERGVMEQGGVVVRWTGRALAEIDMTNFSGLQEVMAQVTRMCIERHPILFRRQQPAAAPASDASAEKAATLS